MRKAGLEMSFGWLFGIIVGAFILFLAIYAVTKIISTSQTESDAKVGKNFGILLNPLETGFESGSSTKLTMPVETRVYNRCENSGIFGRQIIEISQKNFNKWSDTNLEIGFENKYIFSEAIPEGKGFYVFSKPFEFPFKVSDLIFLTSTKRKYCFVDAPDEIEQEINNTGQENFACQDCKYGCGENDVKVCFSTGNCDIKVDYQEGFVEKSGKRMYFEGKALMYAAIFSEQAVYECQLKRLMKRLSELAKIYSGKAIFISDKCNSDLNLVGLISSANNLQSSIDLRPMGLIVEDIKNKNDNNEICRLW